MVAGTSRVVASGFALPESPRWHGGRLWFSDIFGGKVHRMDDGGSVETVSEFGRPSGLGFLPDGETLVVDMSRKQLARLRGADVVASVDLGPVVAGEVNDLVVDGLGRAYIGDTGQTIDETFDHGVNEGLGQVLLAPPDGPPRVVATGLVVPNGIGVAPDGRTLVVAECFGPMRLAGFTIQADGSLTDRRTVVQFSQGAPDGLCFDAEGAVWVAVHPRPGAIPHPSPPAVASSGSEFVRVLDGEVVDRVSVTDRWPLACALGGADRRTLFMCTAEPPHRGDARAMHRGFIEAVTVEVPGGGWP
jgi:sugar lactone lactonase YvrE